MTITEANDVATLLTLLGTAQTVEPDRVVQAAERLELRVHKALLTAPRVDLDVVRDTTNLLIRPEFDGEEPS